MKTKIILILFFLLLPLELTAYSYTPMEKIPGFEDKEHTFPVFIENLYKFGIWTIGIAALLMIIIGGFFYFTAAGNTSKTGKGKEIIFNALFGLVAALAAWLLLYVINPDLVKVNISFKPADILLKAQEIKSGIEYPKQKVTEQGTHKYPTSSAKLPSQCLNKELKEIFKKVGVSEERACILMATAAKESSCRKVPPRSHGGRDCSMMQIDAKTHCKTDCSVLEADVEKAVKCANGFLGTCQGYRNSPKDQEIRDIYAGYNGGCGALGSSKDCEGMKNEYGNNFQKWDCPKDCGGYCPVPMRTSIFLNYYKQCLDEIRKN